MSDRDVKLSTKAALGFFGGLKISAIYWTFISPILARNEVILNKNKTFWKEYFKISGTYSFLFMHTFIMMFATRQAIDMNWDNFVRQLRKDFKIGPKTAQLIVWFGFCIPWGWSSNLIFTRRLFSGSFTFTLW